MTSAVAVRVPATSANLGPGFDSLGLALEVHDELVAMVSDDPGCLVEIDGEGADYLPRDDQHLVVQSMYRAFDALGERPAGFVLRCSNAVPQSRGLGSSAAAIVGGLVLARALVVDGEDRLGDDALLALATSMEGHPDNVAAALFGGFTVAWGATGEDIGSVRLDVHPDIVPIVFLPGEQVSTSAARSALPQQVTHSDAAYNVSRAALLVHAMTTDPSHLLVATDDRLHQRARAEVYPGTWALVSRLRSQGVPAVVSGAGPAVLALVTADDAARALGNCPEGWLARPVAVNREGATVAR